MSEAAEQTNIVTNNNLEVKLDKILQKLELESKRTEEHFLEIKDKLSGLDIRTTLIEKRLEIVEEQNSSVINAVGELDAEINILQQERLSKNILVSGVPLKENSVDELKVLFTEILALLGDKISTDHVSFIGRFGYKDDKGRQNILVKFTSTDAKQTVMTAKKKKELSCAMFSGPASIAPGSMWGTSKDKIYFADHMTPMNSLLNREARKLKADKKVKFVWTINGTTYVKKADSEKSVKIHSTEDIQMMANETLPALRRSARRKLLSPEKTLPDSKRDKATTSIN